MSEKPSRKAASKPKEATAAKKPSKKGPSPAVDLSHEKDTQRTPDASDSEDDIFMDVEGSLLERIANRLSITPKKQMPEILLVDEDEPNESSASNLDSKKRPSPRGSDKSITSSEKAKVTSPWPVPKKSRNTTKKPPVKKATKKQDKKPASKPRRKVIESDSEDDSELEEVVLAAPRSRSTRGRKVNYAIAIDSDSDNSDISSDFGED